MNFKDVFERYKNNQASSDEIQTVEEEIEKNRLISAYLEEETELHFQDSVNIPMDDMSEIKNIKKSIKKRNRHIILASVSIVICLALIINLIALPLLNKCFYDPTVGKYSEYASDFAVSMSAFTELHFPNYVFNHTQTEKKGLGNYEITLIRQDKLYSRLESMQANLNRNNLTLPYDFWKFPSINIFCYAHYPFENPSPQELIDTKNYLTQLPNYLQVRVNISFNRDLTMGELAALNNKYDTGNSNLYLSWAGIRNAENDTQRLPPIGFQITGSGPYYENINQYYKDFEIGEYLSSNNDQATGALYESHFKTLLNYQIDHADFLKVLDPESGLPEYYKSVLDYVNQNGIKAYGVTVTGSPSAILEFCKEPYVCRIVIDDTAFKNY